MSRPLPIERDIIILVPKSYNSTKRGKFFEDLCAEILSKQSYRIISHNMRQTGMEIDITAEHKPSGKIIYVECKFFHSKKVDANVVDLCFAQAVRANIKSIALFSTMPLGKEASGVFQAYRNMKEYDYSFYGKDEILEALEASGKVKSINPLDLKENITHASLLIHPELPMTWLFQEMFDGTAKNLIAYSESKNISCKRIREILDSERLFENINVKNFTESASNKTAIDTRIKEVVSKIIVADDIMDYKPCRPEDFVGRDAIQKEIWDYLEDVINKKVNTRLLSIVGSSGNGKSSLVAYLSERFRNKKWRNKFYLYPIDVRSARGARFVSEAVVKAYNSAIADKFIDIGSSFFIENVNNITFGAKFQACSKYLQEQGKVIVIFFDQFEEVFMKEELSGLFTAFQRFALDVASEKGNLVVGFSWRSGITLGDENPAYSMWNNLRDFRTDKKLTEFDEKDSSRLISGFEKNSNLKLNRLLRKRLIQQAQGFPWLLKKICIHVFNKIKEGISQEQLLVSQLQIKSLFDEDLERPDKERACLKYVANNSPVDQYETTKEFGQQTVSNLLASRLLIKTGEKISVYWDVFRDYLITNETPVIPWSYMPSSSRNMSLKILNAINCLQCPSFENIQSYSNYKKSTLINTIADLQSFSLVEKNIDDHYVLTCAKEQVAEVIRSHLKVHVVYVHILRMLNDTSSEFISLDEFNKIVHNVYANKDNKTPKGYSSKLISWFKYAGLISSLANNIRVYKGDDYSPEFNDSSSKKYLFLAATSPEKSISLIKNLREHKRLNQERLDLLKARNAVTDLVSLGICTKNEASELIFSRNVKNDVEPEHILALAISKSESILILKNLIRIYGINREVLSKKFQEKLGKQWKDSSRKRYLTGLIKYLEFSNAYLEKSIRQS